MQTPPTNVSKDLLASIYNITDFYAFFNTTRHMVQDYLLGGVSLEKRQYAVVYGYEEPRFQYIFVNNTDLNDDFFEGNDIDVDSNISPILPLLSHRVNN